jgi:hypothetical protein
VTVRNSMGKGLLGARDRHVDLRQSVFLHYPLRLREVLTFYPSVLGHILSLYAMGCT